MFLLYVFSLFLVVAFFKKILGDYNIISFPPSIFPLQTLPQTYLHYRLLINCMIPSDFFRHLW